MLDIQFPQLQCYANKMYTTSYFVWHYWSGHRLYRNIKDEAVKAVVYSGVSCKVKGV